MCKIKVKVQRKLRAVSRDYIMFAVHIFGEAQVTVARMFHEKHLPFYSCGGFFFSESATEAKVHHSSFLFSAASFEETPRSGSDSEMQKGFFSSPSSAFKQT